jgi:hypothetical protein
MTNQELIQTLKIASAGIDQNNIPLKFLLLDAALRIQELDKRVSDMGWELNPERMGQ